MQPNKWRERYINAVPITIAAERQGKRGSGSKSPSPFQPKGRVNTLMITRSEMETKGTQHHFSWAERERERVRKEQEGKGLGPARK